ITGPDTFAFPDLAGYVPGEPTAFGFIFTGGTLGGSGTVTLNTTALLGWTRDNLNVSLVNHNVATMANDGGPFTLGPAVTFTNAPAATLRLEFGQTIDGVGTLVNQAGGTLLLLPTPTQNHVNINVPVTNDGQLIVQGGNVSLSGGLTNSNQVSVQGG